MVTERNAASAFEGCDLEATEQPNPHAPPPDQIIYYSQVRLI